MSPTPPPSSPSRATRKEGRRPLEDACTYFHYLFSILYFYKKYTFPFSLEDQRFLPGKIRWRKILPFKNNCCARKWGTHPLQRVHFYQPLFPFPFVIFSHSDFFRYPEREVHLLSALLPLKNGSGSNNSGGGPKRPWEDRGGRNYSAGTAAAPGERDGGGEVKIVSGEWVGRLFWWFLSYDKEIESAMIQRFIESSLFQIFKPALGQVFWYKMKEIKIFRSGSPKCFLIKAACCLSSQGWPPNFYFRISFWT